MHIKELVKKYNIPGPRYTSYPTVPYWENQKEFSIEKWKKTIIKNINDQSKEGLSLYIHLPFCESLCTFCGCHKHITKQHSVENSYIETILKEWQLYLSLFQEKPLVREIHIGGGTPTFFSAKNLNSLLTNILETITIDKEYEFSFEGHPNNTTKEHLETLYNLGFRRVSFGVQDYDETVQRTINRIQPYKIVEKVHNLAKKIGYTSISHDIIFGLPHQTKEKILNTIKLTNNLKPDRISFYSYAHVPWIKGVGQRGFDEKDLPQNHEKRILYEKGKEALEKNGYYEIGMDHFSLQTDKMYQAFKNSNLHRNFMGYTTNTTSLLLGLGVSAISDSWYAFAQNNKVIKEYQNEIQQGKLALFRGHFLSEDDLIIRQKILDLMCKFHTKIDMNFRSKKYFPQIIEQLTLLEKDDLVQINKDSIIITDIGKLFIRNICMCFDLKLYAKKNQERMFSMTI